MFLEYRFFQKQVFKYINSFRLQVFQIQVFQLDTGFPETGFSDKGMSFFWVPKLLKTEVLWQRGGAAMKDRETAMDEKTVQWVCVTQRLDHRETIKDPPKRVWNDYT